MTGIDRQASILPATGAGWGWILGYGILSAVLGLAAFAQPLLATVALTVIVGVSFVMAGIVSVVAGIAGRGHEGRSYAVLFGLVSLAAGMLTLLFPAGGALSITLVVAAWLLARGVLELVAGVRRRLNRAWMLLLGAVNILLAAYVLAALPWSALTLPGFVLGISFLLGGVQAIVAGLAHRRGAPAFAAPA